MPDFNTTVFDYNNTLTQKVETALLDIWGRLGEYREYLVFVGGLAPRYITAPKGTSCIRQFLWQTPGASIRLFHS